MSDISPELLMDTVLGYFRTSAIKAAIELDVFTAIAEGAGTVAAISRRTGAAEPGIQALADYLTVLGFLDKSGDGYRLTASSAAFLDRRSPAFLGDFHRFLAAPEMLGLALSDPAAFVRNGGSVGLANTAPEDPVWVSFARYMAPFFGPIAEATAAHFAGLTPAPGRILDIAAGHGLFGIAFARRFPAAEVVALDWDNVLGVARENAAAAGLGARYRTLPGSAFDVPFGGPYDIILMPNFLHHFDEAACIGLLAKARAALAPSGRVAIVEFVPNEDRVSPPMPAMFAYIMLATTPGGTSFPPSALRRMLAHAGFREPDFAPLAPSPQTLVVAEVA
ncbi:class I SAM-dependent methyltransferase [Inquilinus sp. Marseille-Q2685]|uniref:class I SAM-dependent methyltransferase n=1 Tax=Inquilinus sp. Marseille-Q2685 TaxID=2866581 RepID=UPI001CE3E50A|nr:class I SAM-dependent methyltransferase [Inquilinus sp. Marseille-Q2685]